MRIPLAAAAVLLTASIAVAQCLSEVQVDVAVPIRNGAVRFVRTIAPGDARVVGWVRPQPGGETVRVDLRFDYRIPADMIALDEIICEITVTVEDEAGNEVARSVIDPNSINLNPNRVPLFYATTLYVTDGAVVRVRVRGNYE